MTIENYVYVPFKWINQIIEIDEFGDVVYEKDNNGNIVLIKDDHGNLVLDPITKQPIPQPKILQEGTRHTAKRDNHQEEGIEKAHIFIQNLLSRLIRVETLLDIDNRVDPNNKGLFVDNFKGAPDKMIRLFDSVAMTESRAAGTSVLNVDNSNGLTVGMEVTIYDGNNTENRLIIEKTSSTITVDTLEKPYAKGAIIARSSAIIGNGQVINGKWATYGVTGEVI